ncbi:MAG: 30S ribosomal protein S18 [Anaerolineae bacterium]|jgi:small subunit ribosomal protein S18|nr:30S ribosomal protein S18 [Anaerolineae bacterium]
MDFDRDDRPRGERRGGGGAGGGDRRRGERGDRVGGDRPDRDDRDESPRRGGRRGRARTYYCPEGRCFDYKEIDTLQRFIGETGKIKPRRQTGSCARCQRELAREVKRARHLALLPFVEYND